MPDERDRELADRAAKLAKEVEALRAERAAEKERAKAAVEAPPSDQKPL